MRADNRTTIVVVGEAAAFDDLKPDMDVWAVALPARPGHPTAELRIDATSPHVTGTLASIDGPTLTLDVASPGKAGDKSSLKVETDDQTRVIVLGHSEKSVHGHIETQTHQPTAVKALSDLRPGMTVQVIPPTGKAAKIIASCPPPIRRAASTTKPAGGL